MQSHAKLQYILDIIKNFYLKNKIRKNFKALEKYNKRLDSDLVKVGCIVDMDAVKDVIPYVLKTILF